MACLSSSPSSLIGELRQMHEGFGKSGRSMMMTEDVIKAKSRTRTQASSSSSIGSSIGRVRHVGVMMRRASVVGPRRIPRRRITSYRDQVASLRCRSAIEENEDDGSGGDFDVLPPPPPPPAAAKAIGLTPRGYSLYEALEGQADWKRVSVETGIVGSLEREEFMIAPLLKDSNIITLTLPRPAGLTFSPDTTGLIRLVEINKQTKAGQRVALSRLGVGTVSGENMAPKIGDILRAHSTTTIDAPLTASLTGELSGVKRRVVLHGCDGQSWSRCSNALAKGRISDGDLFLVLERPGEDSRASVYEIDDATISLNEEDTGDFGSTQQPRGQQGMYTITGFEEDDEDMDSISDAKGQRDFNGLLLITGLTFLTLVLTGFY
uniref:Uncharacterized protein n=1 Tax=Lotharella globosa TaxID=91324 RepID=A0A6U2ZRB3_9EUKA